ncbi:hypothetical protein M3Y99_00289500 [Aphelenchoides fujianensis]|nr:hypothetical protein M3Y99_00289500 [Aphelenchoides fujianensis]
MADGTTAGLNPTALATSGVNSFGCPKGFRPLKASSSRPLVCKPGEKQSCPGDAICFEDPGRRSFHCCAQDPTEGCASGMRSLRLADGSARLCRPEAANSADSCPGAALCQWSFLIDRYQCCEPDNGCARGEEPVRRVDGGIRACQRKEDCPLHAHCSFNFWSASLQCCRRDPTQLCPASQVAYLNAATGVPVECATDGECAAGYRCSSGFCCGRVAACPRPSFQPTRDENGRLRSCLLAMPDCPEGSSCEASLTDRSQGLCCSRTLITCRESGTPFPNGHHPQVCELNAHPSSCPDHSDCQQSNMPGTSICCRRDGTITNVCPDGWTLLNQKTKFCSPNDRQPCPNQSSCLLSPLTQQFICCVPASGKKPQMRQFAISRQNVLIEYNCPGQYAGPEVVNNRERRCNGLGDWNQCSIGFVCVPSIEDIRVQVCCGPTASNDSPDFRCPNAADTPALSAQGRNIFCDAANGFQHSTCQSAYNSFGMMICCHTNPAISPICPEGRSAQSAVIGYVPCDINQPNQCSNGYVCLTSLNQPQTALCCSRLTTQALICPNQQVLYKENGRPKICNANQINPCPSGFLCQQSVGSPGVSVCCSLPSTATCPQGYTPRRDFDGNPIYCSEFNPNVCPGGTQCLDSPNRPNTRLCCQTTQVQRVCPDDLDALLVPGTSRPEVCTEPGAACSQSGYSCYLSDVLASYVCCGRSPQQARCADGRETYIQDFSRTFTCSLTRLNDCPLNFDCAPSNLNGVNVCCKTNGGDPATPTPFPPLQPTELPTFRPPVQELTCPVGWSAYEDNSGAHHFCQNALDSSCPQGFSCVQSSVSGIFLCCRLAANLRCGNPRTSPLLVNNAPRLCSQRFAASCPLGFSCQPSSITPVYICCSNSATIGGTSTNGQGPTINGVTNPNIPLNGGTNNGGLDGQVLCRDGQTPAFVQGRTLQCNYLGTQDQCPPTYVCSLSNRQGVNVCCHVLFRSRSPHHLKRAHQNVCGDAAVALTYDNEPIECSKAPSEACPKDFECQPSMVDEFMYCCQDAHIRLCCPLERPLSLETLPSLLAQEEKPRCLGRRTFLLVGNAISCADQGGCPADYDCSSLTTTGDSICCERAERVDDVCPENRDPYRHVSTDEPALCSPNDADSCPEGFICRSSAVLKKHVCCSPIAFCPPSAGRVPLIDARTKHAKRCFELNSAGTSESEQCARGYACVESTVPRIRVCCSTKNAEEFVLGESRTADRDDGEEERLWTILEG